MLIHGLMVMSHLRKRRLRLFKYYIYVSVNEQNEHLVGSNFFKK